MICPICARFTPDAAPRCDHCAADLRDPEVLAMARAAAAAPSKAPTGVAAGALAHDRFLGLSGAGLVDGRSLRNLAFLGAALLAVGFVFGVKVARTAPDGDLVHGPWAARYVPLVLAGCGALLGAVGRRRLPIALVGALLAAAGLVELLLGLAPLGFVAGAPRALPALTWLGLTCAGVGVAVRVLRPGELVARWLVVAGAALFLIGALWPHDDIARVLPEELAALHPPWQPASGTILGTAWDGLGVGALVAVVSAWWLAPVALLPLVTLLTWRRPTGLWDGAGHWLRLLGAAVALWLPLACALLAFNLMGWDAPRDLADLVLGRIRLALYATAATLWVVGGATAAILVWRDSQVRDAGGPTA